MDKAKQKIYQKECEEVHEIYQSLNIRQMAHLIFLMSKHIEIPHAFNDGVVRGMEVSDVFPNGSIIQINTRDFSNHVDNMEDGKD